MGDLRGWLWVATSVVVFGTLLWLNSRRYLPFLADDTLISLRYAERFLAGQGLTWTDGAPVEGYSNLLWILVVAVIGSLGVDLVFTARLLGVASMLLLAFVVAKGSAASRSVAPLLGLALMAMLGPVAVWTIAGLETPLVALLLCVALIPVLNVVGGDHAEPLPPPIASAVSFGLLCLTRPDAPLFVIGTLATVALCEMRRGTGPDATLKVALHWRWFAWLAVVPAGFVLAQLAFRLAYYGEWVPNTALIKLAFTAKRVEDGLGYVLEGLRELRPFGELSVILIVVGSFHREARAKLAVLSVNALLWIAYVAFIGGDIFPAWRHLVPLIVLMTLSVIVTLEVLEQRRRVLVRAVAPVAVAALCAFFWRGQMDEKGNHYAITERWEWNGQALGLLLKDAFGRSDALVAVTAAGCIPYWSRLNALDMMGLNDHHIAHHPPPDLGQGHLGHEHVNVDYILGREPDLIVFHTGTPPMAPVGRRMQHDRRFKRDYQAVRVLATRPMRHRGTIYVRRSSPRVGIQASASGLRIPGYLVPGRDPASINRDGVLVGHLRAGESASVDVGGRVPLGAINVRTLPPNAAQAARDPKNANRIIVRAIERVEVEAIVISR